MLHDVLTVLVALDVILHIALEALRRWEDKRTANGGK